MSKAIDILAVRESETVAVEIAISKPFSKEVRNAVSDFRVLPGLTRLIFAVTDSKTKGELEKLLASEQELDGHRDKIEVRLIGDFLRT